MFVVRLRDLLAGHLRYQYILGHLRWPKHRKFIERKYNEQPWAGFPDAGDLRDIY